MRKWNFLVFFLVIFKLIPKYSDCVNSYDCVRKISPRYNRNNPNFTRSIWRNCRILSNFSCITLAHKLSIVLFVVTVNKHRYILCKWTINNTILYDVELSTQDCQKLGANLSTHLVLKQWIDVHPGEEFRAFIQDGKMLGEQNFIEVVFVERFLSFDIFSSLL